VRAEYKFSPLARAVLTLAGFGAVAFLAGCGAGAGKPDVSSPAVSGAVHGGQQPVSGASIQLYAAGTTGYGSAAAPLLNPAVTSDASGNFTYTGLYTCSADDAQVYMVASGGNPGMAPGTNNSALALMAALGRCGSLGSVTFVNIDEVTTVASVYALAQFLSAGGGAKLGASSTNTKGLTNAFATVNNLVNISSGRAPGPSLPAGATAPTTELNTLADILATCVNSNGSTGECAMLFAAATPSGGSAPTNTIDAILDIAHNQGNNVSALYDLLPATPPFQPTLSSAPNDWTVIVDYVGGGADFPLALAIDPQGNIWTENLGDSAHATSLSKFSPTGVALSPADTGFTGGGLTGNPFFMAIDGSGDVWVPVVNGLIEFSNAGSAISPSGGYTGGGLNFSEGIAIDGSDNVWVVNFVGVSLSKFANDGTPLSPSTGYTGGCLQQPDLGIAIDSAGNVWAGAGGPPPCLSEFANSGAPISPSTGYTGGGLQFAFNLAIDASDDVWAVNPPLSMISEFSNSGAALSPPGGFTGGGLQAARNLAVDGASNVWLSNCCSSVSEFSNAGVPITPSTGYQLTYPFNGAGIAVDGSGNVWIADEGGSFSADIAELVGAAAPVVTPLATAVKNNKLGQRP
jgi:hypothetical protein